MFKAYASESVMARNKVRHKDKGENVSQVRDEGEGGQARERRARVRTY